MRHFLTSFLILVGLWTALGCSVGTAFAELTSDAEVVKVNDCAKGCLSVVDSSAFSQQTDAPRDDDCNGSQECHGCGAGCCHIAVPGSCPSLIYKAVDSDGVFSLALLYDDADLEGPKDPPKVA